MITVIQEESLSLNFRGSKKEVPDFKCSCLWLLYYQTISLPNSSRHAPALT